MHWSDLVDNPFEHPLWIAHSRTETLEALAEASDMKRQRLGIKSLEYACQMLLKRQSSITLLDIGGGVGQIIPYLEDRRIHFTVVDGPHNVEVGNELFKHNESIWFRSAIPKDEAYDLICLNGALQYIENWTEAVRTMLLQAPKFFFLGRLPVHDLPTIDGIQKIEFGQPPVNTGSARRWVFSIQEITAFLAESGYEVMQNTLVHASYGSINCASPALATFEIRSMLFRRSRNPLRQIDSQTLR